MAGDSSGHHRNARVGYAQIVPNNDYGGKLTTSNDYQARQGDQSCLHQRISKKSIVDKQTGIYARATNKEVVSSGETFKERSIGRTGFKDEYKTISTYRFGDKSGYNEYLLEERFRRVNFDGSGSRINNGKCSGGSYQHHGGHGSSKYDSLSYKNYGSSSKNYGSSINNGNYGGGSYQNYGGRSNSKYGSLSFKDNGNYCGGWDKNFGDSNKGNKQYVYQYFPFSDMELRLLFVFCSHSLLCYMTFLFP
ncbi:hypothetical protein DITRI_Ditri14bG0105400 [Diplodiscus trichospermus]